MGVGVTPGQLRGSGGKILDTADALHANIGTLDGAQHASADANGGFTVSSTAIDCENDWEDVLRALGAKIAVDGDNLVLNANDWTTTESTNASSLSGG